MKLSRVLGGVLATTTVALTLSTAPDASASTLDLNCHLSKTTTSGTLYCDNNGDPTEYRVRVKCLDLRDNTTTWYKYGSWVRNGAKSTATCIGSSRAIEAVGQYR